MAARQWAAEQRATQATGVKEAGLVEERLHRFHEVLGDTLVHFFADFQPFD